MEKRKGVLTLYALSELLAAESVLDMKDGTVHYFQNGEELVVFKEDGSIIFKGVVRKMHLRYEEMKRYKNLMWYQKGFTPEEWKELCGRKLRAEVASK
jgi:hypothetical protein